MEHDRNCACLLQQVKTSVPARPDIGTLGALKAHVDAGGIDYGTGLGQLHLGGDLYYAPSGNAFQGLIDEPAVLGRAIK